MQSMPLYDVGTPMWNFITNQLLELQLHAEEGRKASVAADIPVCLENSKSVCHYQYHDEIMNTNL